MSLNSKSLLLSLLTEQHQDYFYYFLYWIADRIKHYRIKLHRLLIIFVNNTTGINWRRELLNIITTQNFIYNYNGEHCRTFEGHAGTDEASARTDASARRAPQTAGSEQRRTPQAATCPDAAAYGRHQEGRRDYGTTASDAPIPSFRLHCRAMEGLSATLRDVCQRQLCT